MIVQICVGSSCHLRGSHDIIELMTKAIKDNHLDCDVTLAGSFCAGRCNREGVTITVDDEIYHGITRENFKDFFNDKILKAFKEGE